jgi:hypothetical protein
MRKGSVILALFAFPFISVIGSAAELPCQPQPECLVIKGPTTPGTGKGGGTQPQGWNTKPSDMRNTNLLENRPAVRMPALIAVPQ